MNDFDKDSYFEARLKEGRRDHIRPCLDLRSTNRKERIRIYEVYRF